MPKKPEPKRAYTKGGQPLTLADLRVLAAVIDYVADDVGESDLSVVDARQALRNTRELRNRLLREGRGYYLT